MQWLLVILSIVGTDVSAQTLSQHVSMAECFEARRHLTWEGMQGPELLCVREKPARMVQYENRQ